MMYTLSCLVLSAFLNIPLGKINLPTLDILKPLTKQPMLLEIYGGELPKKVTQVAGVDTQTSAMKQQGPNVDSVVESLSAHGVNVQNHKLRDGHKESQENLMAWIEQKSQGHPVVILHHPSMKRRASSEDSGTDSTVELTEFQISQYQICLWTALGFVLIMAASICSILNMEVIPDSILYAKFQSGRTGKSD
mmetsp:Transcript_32313/g.54471  ORF Transcript_32313/g.54471 Transcript_32313/m.54471 type:complete len:192 (-) Transcript_32313:233-808(-)